MRGLDERVALAYARIAALIDPESEQADVGAVYYEAYALGVRDYQAGEVNSPIMFRGEPEMLKAWNAGQDYAAEMEDMATCAGCQDSDLPMCPVHG